MLVEEIRSRRLSPVELLDAVLARVAALDHRLHAFVTLDEDRARAASGAAEVAVMQGASLGPLHGIPDSIKDLEPTAGLRTTYGSKFFEHHVPDFDGVVAGRLSAAGAIVFGKTNTPQFGHKDICDNLLMAAFEQARRFMERYDLLLTPQMPSAAWSFEHRPAEFGGRATPTIFDRLPFTFPFNLTGWPAASVPCGFDSEGLPVALQIVTPWHQDTLCRRASAAFEARPPWAAQRPPC